MSDSIVFNDYTLSDEYVEYKPKPFYKKKKYIIPLILAIIFCSIMFFPRSSIKMKARNQADSISRKISNFSRYNHSSSYTIDIHNIIVSIMNSTINSSLFLDNIQAKINLNPSNENQLISACFEGAIRSGKFDFFSEIKNAFPYYKFSEDDLILAICLQLYWIDDMIGHLDYYKRSTYGMSAFGYYVLSGSNLYREKLKLKYYPQYTDDLGISIAEYDKYF